MKIDLEDTYLWHFRLQRLEAEPIWDSILSAAGNLDLTVGGPSFSRRRGRRRSGGGVPRNGRRYGAPTVAALT